MKAMDEKWNIKKTRNDLWNGIGLDIETQEIHRGTSGEMGNSLENEFSRTVDEDTGKDNVGSVLGITLENPVVRNESARRVHFTVPLIFFNGDATSTVSKVGPTSSVGFFFTFSAEKGISFSFWPPRKFLSFLFGFVKSVCWEGLSDTRTRLDSLNFFFATLFG